MEWVRLAGPNAAISYGMRKRVAGEQMLFGSNPDEHWGIKPWIVRDGVATDPSTGKWAFVNEIHWYSVVLPPTPMQNDT